MIRRRIVSTVVLVGALALAGCGSSAKSPTGGSPGGSTPATSPAPTGGGGGGYGGY